MPYELRQSAIDPSFYEIAEGGSAVKEIQVPFRISKRPRPFASVEEAEEWVEKESARRAEFIALKLLERKGQSSLELTQKLARKGYSPEVCERVLEKMRRLGYVEDDRLSEGLIERELKRGHGPRYIEMKLRSLGLNPEEVRRRVTSEMQQEAIRRWIPKLKNPAPALQRRGFDPELIFSELKNFLYGG